MRQCFDTLCQHVFVVAGVVLLSAQHMSYAGTCRTGMSFKLLDDWYKDGAQELNSHRNR
jgi:hypothetical protein